MTNRRPCYPEAAAQMPFIPSAVSRGSEPAFTLWSVNKHNVCVVLRGVIDLSGAAPFAAVSETLTDQCRLAL